MTFRLVLLTSLLLILIPIVEAVFNIFCFIVMHLWVAASVNSIRQLSMLTYLDLFDNRLKGTLDPIYFLTKLKYLSMRETLIHGGVESGIQRLSALTYFNLYGVQTLTGTLATQIDLLTNLEDLYATYNGLRSPYRRRSAC